MLKGKRRAEKTETTEDAPERAHLALRTRQVQYLEYIAERDDIAISHAFRKIIDQAIERIYVDPPSNTQKVRKHFLLTIKCVKFLNLLATRWGIPQSDVARRLIDDAAARDQTV